MEQVKKMVLGSLVAFGCLFIVFAITCALGVLTSHPAQAQIQTYSGYFFPRQPQFWSLFVTDLIPADANEWHGNNGGVFTVARDNAGRLPVVTAMHTGKGTDAGINFNLSLADVNTHTISQFLTSADTFHDGGIGVLLPPGTYFIQWSDNKGLGDMKRLLLSGYWANP